MIAAVTAVVLIESAGGLQFVKVPTQQDDGGVGLALRQLPPGPVLELPLRSTGTSWYTPTGGAASAFVEAPRQLVALYDGHPRVNGYSGYQPPGFEALAQTLNQFPAPTAVAQAVRLGVRYIVLRTALVGVTTPANQVERLDQDGVARYADATARTMLSRLDATSVTGIETLPGGYLIELHPANG